MAGIPLAPPTKAIDLCQTTDSMVLHAFVRTRIGEHSGPHQNKAIGLGRMTDSTVLHAFADLTLGSTQGPNKTKTIGLGWMTDSTVLHVFAKLMSGCILALYSSRYLTYSWYYMLLWGSRSGPPTLNAFVILGIQTGSSLYLCQLSYFYICT